MLRYANNYTATQHRIDCPWHEGMLDKLLENTAQYDRDSRRTVIDIGASYGWFSVGMSERFDNVHSFELSPSTRAALIKNTEQIENIKVYDVGLGNSDSIVKYSENLISGVTSIVSGRPNTSARIKKLDDFNIKQIDLIKIDVESYEIEVLKGAKETLLANRPVVVCEIRPREGSAHYDKVVKFMETLNYKMISMARGDYVFITEEKR